MQAIHNSSWIIITYMDYSILKEFTTPVGRSPKNGEPMEKEIGIEYHAASSPRTSESWVKKKTGLPIRMEAIVVPPNNYAHDRFLPNTPTKHINKDSIHVMVSLRLCFRTFSQISIEVQ